MIVVNLEEFKRECEKWNLCAEAFADDIDKSASEALAPFEEGTDFFVESGLYLFKGKKTMISFRFSTTKTAVYDEDDDMVEEAECKFVGAYKLY